MLASDAGSGMLKSLLASSVKGDWLCEGCSSEALVEKAEESIRSNPRDAEGTVEAKAVDALEEGAVEAKAVDALEEGPVEAKAVVFCCAGVMGCCSTKIIK